MAISTAYALCGYTVAMLQNIMWLDAVILLPLMVRGIEELFLEKKALYIILLWLWL